MSHYDIKLTKQEAIVLFEWLSKVVDDDASALCDDAEGIVLSGIVCELESVLEEPLQDNYLQLLKLAKTEITNG